MRNLLLLISLTTILQNGAAVPAEDVPVRVVATIKDAQGNFVRNLKANDFQLTENGKTLPLAAFTTDVDTALTIGILLDDSRSMESNNRWDAAVNLSRIVIRMLKPQDEFLLMKFAAEMTQVQGFTTDRSMIESHLRELKPEELGTDVVRSVEEALVKLRGGRNSARGLILVSDAEDNGGGDIRSMSEWINSREVPVFTVAIRPPLGQISQGFGPRAGGFGTATQNVGSLLEGLSLSEPKRGLVIETGDIHKTDTPLRIVQFVQDMDADLRGQYLLGYYSKHDGPSWERTVRVRIPSRPDVRVRARWELLKTPSTASQKP